MKSSSVCPKPWENLLVEVNGDCYFCCFIMRPGGKIGNLRRNTYQEVWSSRRANRIRKAIIGGKIPYCCQGCLFYGEFKHEKSKLYWSYYMFRKAVDAFWDFVEGGFTRRRARLWFKEQQRRFRAAAAWSAAGGKHVQPGKRPPRG